ncbi:MAG: YebC/PmpR family DNA-binding transcriptional regulator, partial [Candidatus Manganitrophaceae bacterium]
ITLDKQKVDEEKLMSIALDAGAEDIKSDDPALFQVLTAVNDFEKVKKAIVDAGLTASSSEVTYLPQTYIKLEGKEAEQMLRLMDALEDHDDVQNVYANFDIPDEVMAKVMG